MAFGVMLASIVVVWSEWLKIKEDFALATILIVKDSGSGFAFPTRSVFLHQIDPADFLDPENEVRK